VSLRVRALEAELGTPLFRRFARRLELTGEGEVLAAAVRRGLDEIARGVAGAGGGAEGPVKVSVLPSFAARWLVPRLAGFCARHPSVEVRILATSDLADLRGGLANVTVRFGRGRYPGLRSEFVMADSVLPVCSQALLRERGPLGGPEAIRRFPLLHDSVAEADDSSGEAWRCWFTHVGQPDLDCEAGQRVSDALLAIEAAVAGLGLALARTSLVADDLTSGRLVAPLPRAVPTAFSYWLVCPPDAFDTPRVAAFRAWLVEEALAFRGTLAGCP
jgi:LysR family glycine cleavage system transcriptional activator